MDKYICHKEVHAFKITDIYVTNTGKARLSNGEDDGIWVSLTYMQTHKPMIGGYYVKYKDGYESFSPPLAFEEGYTKV